ncbi:MAG: dihydrofolate reductase [Muribaculaceae bacterium]|nr:dihydrofolate reductase [Muribaculaceae bacterium]
MAVNLIVALGEKGEIGIKGDLIWKLSSDLKRFKSLTTGHPVIMGRKTWESLPKKPLPGRRNIVLSRNTDFQDPRVEKALSLEEALRMTEGEDPFVIGGAEIYKAFLPFVSHLYLTHVYDSNPLADAYLNIDLEKNWRKTEESEEIIENGVRYRFANYTKV